MAIMWSRIHAELGLAPTPLTHDMLVRAVEGRVRENDDLDWKQALPVNVDKKLLEFAKDVAAMANSRGGLIVFGVREENEEAVEVVGVSNGERERQRLRALAWGRVRPMVDGLVLEPLSDEAGERQLLVLSIPASRNAPHVVGAKNEMGIPYRDGSDTRWMTENQLENAYRDRFARRADDRAVLRDLIDGVVSEVQVENGVWLVIAAHPVAPVPLAVSSPDRDHVVAVLHEMKTIAAEIYPVERGGAKAFGRLSSSVVNNPRTGLRRWVVRSNDYSSDQTAPSDWGHVEVHHDGSIAIGLGLTAWIRDQVDGTYRVPELLVSVAVVQAVALVAAHQRRMGISGPVLMRAELLRNAHSIPMVVVTDTWSGISLSAGDLQVVSGTRAVRKPRPVEAQLVRTDDLDELRRTASQLADDIVQQFGLSASSIST